MKKVLPYMKKTYDWALLPLLDYLSKILYFIVEYLPIMVIDI